jgi:hypothetical protein
MRSAIQWAGDVQEPSEAMGRRVWKAGRRQYRASRAHAECDPIQRWLLRR